MSKQVRKVFDTETFIKYAREKHGDKFDYRKFVYVNAKTKSTVICKIHGEYQQNADKHINSVHGCMECSIINKVKNRIDGITSTVFLNRLNKKFGENNFIIYMENYTTHKEGSIIIKCIKHDVSTTHSPPSNALARGTLCNICASESFRNNMLNSYDSLIERFNIKHDNKYTYPEDNRLTYINQTSIITVICDEHGEFKKKAQHHLSGQGCFKCRVTEMVKDGTLGGGYNETYFKNYPDIANKIGVVYYLKVGRRYKIGITTDISRRLTVIKNKSKQKVEIIDSYETTLYNAFIIEQYILEKYKDNRILRPWTTELFDIDVIDSSLDIIVTKLISSGSIL